MRATLVGRAGVSRPVNEKRRKTSNVVPAIPLRRYITSSTLLSRKVFSLASCRICGGDRLGRWRGSNSFFFFLSLSCPLFFTDLPGFGLSVSVQWKYTLRLFNPEKGNVESIFLNRE